MANFGFLSNMPISSRVKFVSSVRLRVQRFSGPWQIIIEERERRTKSAALGKSVGELVIPTVKPSLPKMREMREDRSGILDRRAGSGEK